MVTKDSSLIQFVAGRGDTDRDVERMFLSSHPRRGEIDVVRKGVVSEVRFEKDHIFHGEVNVLNEGGDVVETRYEKWHRNYGKVERPFPRSVEERGELEGTIVETQDTEKGCITVRILERHHMSGMIRKYEKRKLFCTLFTEPHSRKGETEFYEVDIAKNALSRNRFGRRVVYGKGHVREHYIDFFMDADHVMTKFVAEHPFNTYTSGNLKSCSRKRGREMGEDKEMRDKVDHILMEFVCPISKELPGNPVMADDGRVYEREDIQKWIEGDLYRRNMVSPFTKQRMNAHRLFATRSKN